VRPATRRRVDEGWAHTFGLPADALAGGGVHVVTAPVGASDTVVVRLPHGTVVSTPFAAEALITDALGRMAGNLTQLTNPQAWRAVLGDEAAVLGPSQHAYNDEIRSLGAVDARVIAAPPGIRAALARLARTMPAEEWQEAGFDDPGLVFTFMERRSILAAAHLSPWGGHLVDLGFVTRPNARGRGYGTIVAAAAARDAIERHGLARWRARLANEPSLAVARRLGFTPYGEELMIRLASDRAG
jgi:GNAT superfamily N-acetyltransferase